MLPRFAITALAMNERSKLRCTECCWGKLTVQIFTTRWHGRGIFAHFYEIQNNTTMK